MSLKEIFVKFILTISFIQVVSSTCSDWTAYTSCPAPDTLLADAVKKLKTEITQMNCLVPPEFYSMGVDSAMTNARSALAAYKAKNNITATKVRMPTLMPISKSRYKRQATQPPNTTQSTNSTTTVALGNTTTTAPVNTATTAKANVTTTPLVATPPPSTSNSSGTNTSVTTPMPPPPPPANNSSNNSSGPATTMKPTAAPPPPGPPPKKAPPPEKILRTRLLRLKDMCIAQLKSSQSTMDPMVLARIDKIQSILKFSYDATAPDPSPKTLNDLFLSVNPNMQTFLTKLKSLSPTQLTTMNRLLDQWKQNMIGMLSTYVNITSMIITNANTTQMMQTNMSNDFAKYAVNSSNTWYQIFMTANMSDIPSLITPAISGTSPNTNIITGSGCPCLIMQTICSLIEEGQLYVAMSYSEIEFNNLVPDPNIGIQVADYSDAGFPDQPVVGCGFCYRRVQCCKGSFMNMLEQEINSDVCQDHSSACEVPPMADDTCNYVKTIAPPDFGSMPPNTTGINKIFYDEMIRRQKVRLTQMVDSAVPVMNCTKFDKLCYCCCGGFEPVIDSEGFVICRVYQPPPPTMPPPPPPATTTVKPASSNVTTVSATNVTATTVSATNATTAKPSNTSSNGSVVSGNVTVQAASPVTQPAQNSTTTLATTTQPSNTTAASGMQNSTTKAAANVTTAQAAQTTTAATATTKASNATNGSILSSAAGSLNITTASSNVTTASATQATTAATITTKASNATNGSVPAAAAGSSNVTTASSNVTTASATQATTAATITTKALNATNGSVPSAAAGSSNVTTASSNITTASVTQATTAATITAKALNSTNGSVPAAAAGSANVTTASAITATTTIQSTVNSSKASNTVGKSLQNEKSAISESEEPSAGDCFGSFSDPAQCVDDGCTTRVSWHSMKNPSGLYFSITTKASSKNWWTGIGLNSISKMAKSVVIGSQRYGSLSVSDGYIEDGDNVVKLKSQDSLVSPTITYDNGFLKLTFVITCQSYKDAFEEDICHSPVFYFVPTKGGPYTDLQNLDFTGQAIANGPLDLTGCLN